MHIGEESQLLKLFYEIGLYHKKIKAETNNMHNKEIKWYLRHDVSKL